MNLIFFTLQIQIRSVPVFLMQIHSLDIFVKYLLYIKRLVVFLKGHEFGFCHTKLKSRRECWVSQATDQKVVGVHRWIIPLVAGDLVRLSGKRQCVSFYPPEWVTPTLGFLKENWHPVEEKGLH